MELIYSEIVLRLAIAIIIGGAIGYERSYKHRPAGFRTHIIVCVGAAIVSMIQIKTADDIIKMVNLNSELSSIFSIDTGRLGAQVISGIGFIGAGTILKSKGTIRGLTTAASLWTVAAIGLAIGMGYYFLSVVSGISLIAILFFMEYVELKFMSKQRNICAKISFVNREALVKRLEKLFYIKDVKIKSVEFLLSDKSTEEQKVFDSRFALKVPMAYEDGELIKDIAKDENVLKVEIS